MGSLTEKDTWKLIVQGQEVQLFCLVKHKQCATDWPVLNKEWTFVWTSLKLARSSSDIARICGYPVSGYMQES